MNDLTPFFATIRNQIFQLRAWVVPRKWVFLGMLMLGSQAVIASDIDRIIVIVNDDIITENEFNAQLNTIKRQLRLARRPSPPEVALKKQVLERLVIDRIQLQYAERTGIKVSSDQIDAAIEQIAKRNKITVQQLRGALKRDRIDYQSFRKQIESQVIIGKLIERDISSRVRVSKGEIDNALLSVKKRGGVNLEFDLSHIQVSIPDSASAEVVAAAKQRAESLRDRLVNGLDFEKAAFEYSQGKEALDGGRLGWKKAAELPQSFVAAAEKLKINGISRVIRSAGGHHILKLHNRRGGKVQKATQTHVRHILIKTSELLSIEDASERISQLRQRVLNGESFSDLAKAHSNDTSSGLSGGDLGWASPGELLPRFEKAMAGLKINELSKPIQTRFGVHLIQVLGRREQDVSVKMARGEVRKQIHQRKARERYEQWIRQLRDEAYVEYRLEE
ncbi:MAG TPA: molecular chaperone SurA [Acidiferrobacteraceae bacterium]|nr:molecular chaperone SurA [Acidiferrobacteraceae bacterium]